MINSKSILILTDNPEQVTAVYGQIQNLNYACTVEKKTTDCLFRAHNVGGVFYDLAEPAKDDEKILHRIRAENSYLPLIGLNQGQAPVRLTVAPYLNALLRLPTTNDAVHRKIIRYLEPSTPLQCRIDERREVELGFVWSYPASPSRVHSTTVNLSQGGVFVRENQFSPKRGDILEFILKGKNRAVISGAGIVRWISTRSAENSVQGFGVEFLSKKTQSEDLFKGLGLLT